jgi:uncharacterized protein YndB with AHSA1/START domain
MSPVQESIKAAEAIQPVIKSVRVRASAARAFEVFTRGIDTWWPKTHHIGNSPMTRAVVEGWVGGRLYSEQENGSECQWGTVLKWEPPGRFVLAWQVTPQWQYEPELAKSSEVEVTFTPSDDGTTLVQLEHRFFDRHGAGASAMRGQVDQPGGWGGLLTLYQATAEAEA